MIQPAKLSELLWAQDSAKEPERTNEDYIHVSTLIDFCQRDYALSLRYLKHGVTTYQPSGSERLVWKIGRAVEEHIRDSLIASFGPENSFGRWTCLCKKSYYNDVYHEGMRSPCCDSLYSYKEYIIRDDAHKITGSIDFCYIKEGHLFEVEIKSITDSENANSTGKGFSTLKEPLGTNATQAALYNLLLQDKRFPWTVSPIATVAYGRKEFKYQTPYKEFYIDVSEGTTFNTLAKSIRSLALPVFDKTKLPKRLCKSPEQTRAKNCGNCTACFRED